mgnify:CR=1 FL=1|jgi:hypothetical protein
MGKSKEQRPDEKAFVERYSGTTSDLRDELAWEAKHVSGKLGQTAAR